jgi:hypothetical protein
MVHFFSCPFPKKSVYQNKIIFNNSETQTFPGIEDCIKAFNTEKRAIKERGLEAVEREGVEAPKLERCFAPEQMMVPSNRGKKFRDVVTRYPMVTLSLKKKILYFNKILVSMVFIDIIIFSLRVIRLIFPTYSLE